MTIALIVGPPPNIIKAAAVYHELRARRPDWTVRLIHTGQDYDPLLTGVLLAQLDLPEPDINLGAGAGSYIHQTAGMMLGLEQAFNVSRPDAVIVFGHSNSTLAGALAASQAGIPVAHAEAGLRSLDRSTPEEMNRVLADAVADWLFISEREAEINLRREGIADQKVHFTGNTTIDTLVRHRATAAQLHVAARLGLSPRRYVVATLDKPTNVDAAESLRSILYALLSLSDHTEVIFPVHPRTMKRMHEFALWSELEGHDRLRLIDALGYHEFISLLHDSGAVLTDSGSVQEEAVVIGVPCVTLSRHTARPITVQVGGNRLAGDDPHLAVRYIQEALDSGAGYAPIPEGWDGRAACRIVDVLGREVGVTRVLPDGSSVGF